MLRKHSRIPTAASSIGESYDMPVSKRRSFATTLCYDPLARRPNKICDPYGQGGKPLSREQTEHLLATLEDGWRLIPETNDPTGLVREFYHKDFIAASQFVAKIAAVAHVNNHYPSILLERRLLPKAWQVVTRVECRTLTLEGLSYNDFHMAMVRFKARIYSMHLLRHDRPTSLYCCSIANRC